MTLPAHLFASDDGNLYDTRRPDWASATPLRRLWSTIAPASAFTDPGTRAAAFKAALRHGLWADLGGYAVTLLMADGQPLCAACARAEAHAILRACRDARAGCSDPEWTPAGLAIIWEGPAETCAHCGAEIETIYGDPED